MLKKENLFDQFPPVTTSEWLDKIHADLKGADFNKKLIWKTNEGFDVKPFYRCDDTQKLRFINTLPGEFPYIRGTKIKNNSWLVRQNLDVSDYIEANRKILDIVMKGVDSVGLNITDPESVTEDNLRVLLDGIHLDAIELNFLSNGKAKEILTLVNKITAEKGTDKNKIFGAIEADPLGRLMLNGTLCVPVEAGFDYLASLTSSSSVLPNLRTIQINGSNFTNAGADIVMELAFALSMGSEYLNQLTQRGLSPETVASKIRFSFGIGSNYFGEIAKLRAARLLWSVVVNGFKTKNPEAARMNINSITSRWNKTVYDPYVNMLRTQTESMSAIIGGADSLTVEPFDITFRQPDDFSERIARNQQLILKEESYFDKVVDPAAGSYYVENLTSLIAESSWKLFIDTEGEGGFLASLKSGFVQKKISDSAGRRRSELASRKTVLLGTNQYPNPSESISPSVDQDRIFSKKAEGTEFTVEPVDLWRGSEEYDRLRFSVDRTVKRPHVFLLPIGDPAMGKARSQFSINFFACAGYNVIENARFENVDTGVKKAEESEAEIVVICSSDEEYPLYAPEICTKMNGKAIIVVAGNPPSVAELKERGVEFFIHLRSDVPDTLKIFNARLGINI